MDRETERKIKSALGMDEVMAALNKLVEDCTVGGKKEEPTEDTDKAFAVTRSLAHDVYMMYRAFVSEGFDEDQAFILTHEMLSSFNRKAMG